MRGVLSFRPRVENIYLSREVGVFSIDLASEMAAARVRRDEKTARLLREARVRAIRASVRPGSTREEIEECARSFYPRLNPELLEEAISLVCAPAPGSAAANALNAPTPPAG